MFGFGANKMIFIMVTHIWAGVKVILDVYDCLRPWLLGGIQYLEWRSLTLKVGEYLFVIFSFELHF